MVVIMMSFFEKYHWTTKFDISLKTLDKDRMFYCVNY